MGLLAAARNLIPADQGLRQGQWTPDDRGRLTGQSGDLNGHTLGIVGFGTIGRRVAELGRAFGMRCLAVTHTPDAVRSTEIDRLDGMEGLPRLFEESDYVVVCIPLAPETRGLVGARELDLLGPHGYLANVARGPVVNERALYEALRDRRIAGAAIDVWYRYPTVEEPKPLPSEYPIWELDNVVMTPHYAGLTRGAFRGRWLFVSEQLRRLAEGQPLENVIATG